MASSAVILLGKRFDPPPWTESPSDIRATAIRPLLDFLQLNERHPPEHPPPYPGIIALQAVLATAEHEYFDPAVLPVLTCTLPSTHPPQLRTLALRFFQQPGFDWCSSSAEVFSDMDRASLLEAVGDPFQFTQDPSYWDTESSTTAPYEPMQTVALLIEFASSNLWQDHLLSSNFASCEEVISAEEGRALAFRCMTERSFIRTRLLNSVSRLLLAIRRLQELECWDTAGVVVEWTWTKINDDTKAANHDTHEPMAREALVHFHLRQMQRKGTLLRRIREETSLINADLTNVSQACQLRGLYQLLGCNSVMWEETAAVGKVDEIPLGSDGFGLPQATAEY